MPEIGLQSVMPVHCAMTMPANHIQAVPIAAMSAAWPAEPPATVCWAAKNSSRKAAIMAITSTLSGSSSRSLPCSPAARIEPSAAPMAGKANTSPISAPPIRRPMPSGRFMLSSAQVGAFSAETAAGIQS